MKMIKMSAGSALLLIGAAGALSAAQKAGKEPLAFAALIYSALAGLVLLKGRRKWLYELSGVCQIVFCAISFLIMSGGLEFSVPSDGQLPGVGVIAALGHMIFLGLCFVSGLLALLNGVLLFRLSGGGRGRTLLLMTLVIEAAVMAYAFRPDSVLGAAMFLPAALPFILLIADMAEESAGNDGIAEIEDTEGQS